MDRKKLAMVKRPLRVYRVTLERGGTYIFTAYDQRDLERSVRSIVGDRVLQPRIKEAYELAPASMCLTAEGGIRSDLCTRWTHPEDLGIEQIEVTPTF